MFVKIKNKRINFDNVNSYGKEISRAKKDSSEEFTRYYCLVFKLNDGFTDRIYFETETELEQQIQVLDNALLNVSES